MVNWASGQIDPAVTLAGTISHAPFGGPSGWQFWNQQSVSVGRDPKYRITRLQSSQAPAGAVAQDLTLTYNTANLVTVITDNTAALSESFGYDKLYRLVNSTGSYGALVWKYDATGNRTKQTLNTTVSNLAYPATNNRLTSVGSLTRQYDAAGNLRQELRSDGSTRSYAYNAMNRLSAVTRTVGGSGAMPVASYYHNALGQRVAKYVAASGQWTYYVYDLDGKLLVEQPGNSTAHRDYVYLDALPLALIDVPVNPATQATKAYAIHTDHLGTPMRLTDTTGTVVWALDSTPFDAIHGAFGLPSEDVDLNGISITYNARFPGQYFDAETGLNYNYFRDYDPTTGRYIESDPIGLAGGLNTYAYVGGNPLRYTDSLGLVAEVCVRPTQGYVIPGQHCFVRYNGNNADTSSFDLNGVHPDPAPAEATSCTKAEGRDDDDCVKREYQKCENYHFTGNNCCHCAENALKACGQSIPTKAWPNYPFNPGPHPGEPGYQP
ncbi:MAG: RHS domain-containing protein [Gammaproteobacteria bacterium]|nr:RHS domain-containing protein [Gammaproteobacteria bacterium]